MGEQFLISRPGTKRSNKGIAGLSEFILALSIIFVGLVPPIIDLMGLAVGYGMTQLVARRTAARAANSTDYNSALNEMQTEALSLNNTALAQYCKLAPNGGYGGCGVDLYINETNIYTNKTTTYGPNVTLSAADPSSNIYECTVQANYQVSPLIPMTLIPFFASIEGVGQPFSFVTSWNVALEHPQLLDLNTTAYGLRRASWSGAAPLPPAPPSGALTSWNLVSTGTWAPEPGQTQLASSPYTYSLNDQTYDTGLALTAGQRISFQMLSTGGPGRVMGSVNGVTFETPTNTLDFVVPSSGNLIFTPQDWEGWSTTKYNLEVIVTN